MDRDVSFPEQVIAARQSAIEVVSLVAHSRRYIDCSEVRFDSLSRDGTCHFPALKFVAKTSDVWLLGMG
jgi:hypothetical protein